MCRFVFYRGAPIRLSSLVTEPAHSIIHQSYRSREREEPLNGDGFGVAWYSHDDDRPAVFKDVTPAWNNQNLLSLARVVLSPCVIVHIRAATPGMPVSRQNCHPFSCGRMTFAHNGEVAGFAHIRRAIQSKLSDEAFEILEGSTDSEHLFALFISKFAATDGPETLEKMAAALLAAIAEVEAAKRAFGIEEPSLLNLVLTDGESTVVTRYASAGRTTPHSLYMHVGSAYECIDGVCRMRKRSESENTILVASEPLSQDNGWREVSANSMLLIDRQFRVDARPLRLPTPPGS